MTEPADRHPETLAAQALGHVDPSTAALVPPIHVSTTFERRPDNSYVDGRGYSRVDSPAYDEPEQLLAALEGGAGAMLYGSGMAAVAGVFGALIPGDHVLVPRVVYWGVRKWLSEYPVTLGIDVEYVDTSSVEAVAAAMRPGRTRLVWLETPANPTWEVCDVAAIAAIAHGAGARVVVDSTVAPPPIQRPLTFGADIVMHSATKYLNGHSDVLAGALVYANDDAFMQRVRAYRRGAGAVLGPFEAWLLLRGMRTLFVRVRQQCASALAIATHFETHPALDSVLYPGLQAHAGHDIAVRQMPGGFGGMMSILVRGNDRDAIEVAARMSIFKRATSLGGVESLVEQRRSVEGPSSPVPENLLRAVDRLGACRRSDCRSRARPRTACRPAGRCACDRVAFGAGTTDRRFDSPDDHRSRWVGRRCSDRRKRRHDPLVGIGRFARPDPWSGHRSASPSRSNVGSLRARPVGRQCDRRRGRSSVGRTRRRRRVRGSRRSPCAALHRPLRWVHPVRGHAPPGHRAAT